MPEGPEVESARVLVHNNLAGLRITQAIVADDEKVFVNCKDTLQSALEGRKLLEVKRKGKYLWFLLDGEGPIPLIHFGMTGSIIVQGVGSAKYTRINIGVENLPLLFCKPELVFEEGKRMALLDWLGQCCFPTRRINIDAEDWPSLFGKLELVCEGGKRMAFVD